MNRSALLPLTHQLERLFLLDLLAQNCREVPAALDADAFLAVTPENLHAFVHVQLLNLPNTPAALLERTAPHYRRNVLRMLKRSADLRRLDATLSASGIPYLVLKGPILASTVYADPATRTMLDLDLLVREDDLDRAIAALSAIGYAVPEHFAGWEMNPGDAPPMVDVAFGSAVLELHTALDSIPDTGPALEAAWANARRVAAGHGVEVSALERGEFFAHVVLHISRHHRFEGGLRSLLDVALLLRSEETSTLDWRALDQEWQRRRVSEWMVLTIELAHILFGSPVPEVYQHRHPSAEVLSLAAEQLWLVEPVTVPGRITQAVAGRVPALSHSGTRRSVPVPTGIRYRARREWTRVTRAFNALRSGGLRPRNVKRSVDLLLKRERLFELLENEAPPR